MVYRDYSIFDLQDLPQNPIKERKAHFPLKLFRLLAYVDTQKEKGEDLSSICCWQPQGRSFKIIQKQEFEKVLLTKFFSTKKYESFRKQLNVWGFRLCNNKKSWYHEMFLRSKPELCQFMKRRVNNDSPPESLFDLVGLEEPDFDKFPMLPPTVSTQIPNKATVPTTSIVSESPSDQKNDPGTSYDILKAAYETEVEQTKSDVSLLLHQLLRAHGMENDNADKAMNTASPKVVEGFNRARKAYHIKDNASAEAIKGLNRAPKAYPINDAASPDDLRKALEAYPIHTVANPETDEGLQRDPKASNNDTASFATVQDTTTIPSKAHPINTATKPRAVRGLGRDSTEYQINNNANAVQGLRRAPKAHPFNMVTNSEAVQGLQRDPQDSREYQPYNTAGASQGFISNSDHAFPEAAQCLNREPKAYQTNNTTETAQGFRADPNRNDHSNAAAGLPCLYEVIILPPMYVDACDVAFENGTDRLPGMRLRERDAAGAHGNETRRSMEIKPTERDEAFTRESQKRRLTEMRLVLEKDVAVARENLRKHFLTKIKPSEEDIAGARQHESRRSTEMKPSEEDVAGARQNETRRLTNTNPSVIDLTYDNQKRKFTEMEHSERDVAAASENLIRRLAEMKPSENVAVARERLTEIEPSEEMVVAHDNQKRKVTEMELRNQIALIPNDQKTRLINLLLNERETQTRMTNMMINERETKRRLTEMILDERETKRKLTERIFNEKKKLQQEMKALISKEDDTAK